MPGVTFFRIFMRPEINRKGVVTTPLSRTRVNIYIAINFVLKIERLHTKFVFQHYI